MHGQKNKKNEYNWFQEAANQTVQINVLSR